MKGILSSSFQRLLMIQFYAVSQTCWMNDLVGISSFSPFKMGAVVSLSQGKHRLTPTAQIWLMGGVKLFKITCWWVKSLYVFVCVTVSQKLQHYLRAGLICAWGDKQSNPGFSTAVTWQMMLFSKSKKTIVSTFLHYTKCLIKEFNLHLKKKYPWRMSNIQHHPECQCATCSQPPLCSKSPPGTSRGDPPGSSSAASHHGDGWLPGARFQPAGRLRQNPVSPMSNHLHVPKTRGTRCSLGEISLLAWYRLRIAMMMGPLQQATL